MADGPDGSIPHCTSCQRPVAAAKPYCVYCGAALPAYVPKPPAPAAVPAAASNEASPAERVAVVLDWGGSPAETLAWALGLSAYDAAQRIRRGGYQLHRVFPTADGVEECERLSALGLRAFSIPEAETREALTPIAIEGGRPTDGGLVLRGEEGEITLRPGQAVLIVQGPIAREYQTKTSSLRQLRTATLEAGYRLHLWTAASRPLELDPDDFAFDVPAEGVGSSRLRVRAWIAAATTGAAVDDAFRFLPPALSPSAAPAGLAAALGSRTSGGSKTAGDAAPSILDNVRQFRTYSGWRGGVERRRGGG